MPKAYSASLHGGRSAGFNPPPARTYCRNYPQPRHKPNAGGHEPASFVPAVLKLLLVLVPSAVTPAMQTIMMSANMTAYSTDVGPSSLTKKFTTLDAKNGFIVWPHLPRAPGWESIEG
jgi:hypothetical protein